MMTRYRSWPLAGLLVASLGAGMALAASELKNWHKGEVSVLLTKDEEKAFKKLKNDEVRQDWIDKFWADLDPAPETPESEAKLAFEERVAFVRQNLGEAGWETDMGRTLLILGPPVSSRNETEGAQDGPRAGGLEAAEGSAAVSEQIGEDGAPGDDGEALPARRNPKTVLVWVYKEGTPGLGGNTELLFEGINKISLKTKGVDLSRQSFAASIPKPQPAAAVAAAEPGAGTMQPAAAAQPDDPATAEMRKILAEKRLATDLGLNVEPYFFPSPDGNVYIPILVQADLSSLGTAVAGRPVHVFGAVYKDGELHHDFVLPHSVSSASPLLAKAEVVVPGSYELLIGVRDDASGKYGLVQMPVQTPDFSQPSTSSIIFSPQAPVQAAPPENILDTVTASLQLGPYKFDPYLYNTITPADPLNVFYFVLTGGPTPATDPKLSIHYILQQGDETIKKFSIPELPSAVVAHPLDLSKLKLKPGNYELQLEIKDATSGTTINKMVPLVVK